MAALTATIREARHRSGGRPQQLAHVGAAGFSLLELVVATLVLSTVLLFVAQGLQESQRQVAEAQRSLGRGSTQLATALLRLDARSAHSIASGLGSWGTGPLVLLLPDGSSIVYLTAHDRLERVVLRSGGREDSRQVVARGVLAFRWQRKVADLLEVAIALRPPPRPPRVLDRSAVLPPDPSPIEHVTVALRSRSRSAW
ncbi:MAG TPA: type II secretion system protein [Thermoanaerobaculia bacterium]|nr:type II secretion system protein [Thermoanaerobaculia bacterium]